MKRFITVVGSVALIALAGAAASADMTEGGMAKGMGGMTSLDGTTFEVDLAGAGDMKGPDWLVFDGGTFQSTDCHSYGFTPVSYTTSKAGKAASFEATATSPAAGTMKWTGTVKGDAVEGSVDWTNPKGEVQKATYHGRVVSGPLDGKTFHLKLAGGDAAADASAKEMTDTIMFRHGTFDSEACRSYGFGVTSDSATRNGDSVEFEVKAMSAMGGTNAWKGTIRGGSVEGTLIATDKDGKAVTYSYRGTAE